MSLVKRRLNVTINLGEGKFGERRGPDVTLTGYRTQVSVVAYNGDAQSVLQMRMFGLAADMVNQLTTIGPVLNQRRGQNRILIEAGDDEAALSVVYEGSIDQAWADYSSAPEVVFYVLALGEASAALKPVPPRSYRGTVSVVDVARDIAASLGLALEANGVQGKLANPYFPGTEIDQLRSLARAARFQYTIESGVLAIWPWNGSRDTGAIVVSPENGLIGYPTFTSGGLMVRNLYEPQFGVGKKIQVISTNEPAHGEWTIVALSHQLESEVPGGIWASEALCQRVIDG
ncbi:hypothetical protein CBR67_03705 [Bordetella hinzii]|uniref:baseplate hub protein n=1 Tax=Bordetella hinzii TaxID=103855 RepID=UPI00114D9D52|nr:hypothetical protein [Bordetella hinzii]QDJ35826.1 hypothetical protein CBR67_03705 [Bordetella hinzii]